MGDRTGQAQARVCTRRFATSVSVSNPWPTAHRPRSHLTCLATLRSASCTNACISLGSSVPNTARWNSALRAVDSVGGLGAPGGSDAACPCPSPLLSSPLLLLLPLPVPPPTTPSSSLALASLPLPGAGRARRRLTRPRAVDVGSAPTGSAAGATGCAAGGRNDSTTKERTPKPTPPRMKTAASYMVGCTSNGAGQQLASWYRGPG